MGLLTKKPKCKKYFTTETRSLDISGLSVGLPGNEFKAELGQFKLEPEFVKATEKLMQLDLQQYDLCQNIANISNKDKRDEMFEKLVKIKMQMLHVYENRETYEIPKPRESPINSQQIKDDTLKEYG